MNIVKFLDTPICENEENYFKFTAGTSLTTCLHAFFCGRLMAWAPTNEAKFVSLAYSVISIPLVAMLANGSMWKVSLPILLTFNMDFYMDLVRQNFQFNSNTVAGALLGGALVGFANQYTTNGKTLKNDE